MKRRDLVAGLACAAGLGPLTGARATAPFDIRRYVYVPSATTPDVTIIDTETNSVAGTFRTAIIARQAVISRQAATLIATDGQSAAVSLVDVVSGAGSTVALPAPVGRLTLGTTGRLIAASDLAGGSLALIRLDEDRRNIVTAVPGLPPLRDAMFGELDIALYIAADGVGVIDVAKGRLTHEIATFQPSHSGIAALARTANGRQVLALPRGGGPINVLDPDQERIIARVGAGFGAAAMVPSGTGRYLLVPNTIEATLTVFRSESFSNPVLLPGALGVTGIYTAWLDSVAFMPSTVRQSVLVYDLDTVTLVREIALPGRPGAGAVTADSRTLYLPVQDPPQVVAIDADSRKLAAVFALAEPPLAALVAGGWGICH